MPTEVTAVGPWTGQLINTALAGRYHDAAFFGSADNNAGNTVPVKTWREGVLVTQSATIGGTATPLDLTAGWSGIGMKSAVYAGFWLKFRTGQGVQMGWLAANTQLDHDPGHSVNARKDLIVAELLDTAMGDASLSAKVKIVKGAEAGLNARPALTTGQIALWEVPVAANASSLSGAAYVDLRKAVALRGEPRVLLGGDSLSDPGFVVGERRFRRATGSLPDLIDFWGNDQKWHGTNSIKVDGTIAGYSNNTTATQTLSTIAIPDPGWPYFLEGDSSFGALVGPDVKIEVAFRDGGTAGALLGPKTVWDALNDPPANKTAYKQVRCESAQLTGARTVYLVGDKTGTVGNGVNIVGGGVYSSCRLRIVPA